MFGSTESVVPRSLLVRRSRRMSFSPKTQSTAARTVSRVKGSKSSREKACSQTLVAEEETGRESCARSGGAISRALENVTLAYD
jgi:hypothetical protein